LWVTLKYKAHKPNLHTLEELRNNTRSDILTISGEKLRTVNNELRSRTENIWSTGQYFLHLL
jgi:hypothetical protein